MKKSWIKYCFGFYLFIIIGCNSNSSSSENALPNFIIIFTDDLGYGDLGCYGHPTISTPHLDQMAQEGMRFTQFYSGASVCTPSRAALLTGRLPVRYGMAHSTMRVLWPWSLSGLPQSETTIATMLKKRGYATAAYGKWHLGHKHDHLPLQHGFDDYYGIPFSNDMSPNQTDWMGASVLPPLVLMEGNEVIEEEPDQGKLTAEYTRRSIDFIKRNKDNPFFIYLPHTFPHTPLYTNEKFSGSSERGLYGDVVEELDWSVGEILKTLKKEGLDKNTLVIFTSDNGPWLTEKENGGSAGLLHQGKGCTWEGGMREPMIAWWPGKISPNQTTHSLGTTMDLYRTISTLTKTEITDTEGEDGFDLSPLLFENKAVRDEIVYYLGHEIFAYRKGDYKIHYKTLNPYVGEQAVEHDPPLLFNLAIDPSERFNLSDKLPEKIAELDALVQQHKEGVLPSEDQMWKVDSAMMAPLLSSD